jgi:hypothetical protein
MEVEDRFRTIKQIEQSPSRLRRIYIYSSESLCCSALQAHVHQAIYTAKSCLTYRDRHYWKNGLLYRFITLICTGYWIGTNRLVQMSGRICTGWDTMYKCYFPFQRLSAPFPSFFSFSLFFFIFLLDYTNSYKFTITYSYNKNLLRISYNKIHNHRSSWVAYF